MSRDLKVDYIELPARDLDAVQTFYGRVFNWSFTDYGPDYRAFTDGSFNGGFYRADQQSSTVSGATLVVMYALDLEKIREAVLVAGGSLVKDIFPFPGGRRFQFTDPNGNELAVWSDK
jgi:predicted enzyme related to lactoylglutathione lyase